MQYSAGRGNRVFPKGAKKAGRGQLQRIAQSVAVAPLGGDPLAVIVVEVEVARQCFAGKRIWIAAVAFPLRGAQEADRHDSKRLGAEGGRCDDARAVDAVALQQPGATVAGHEVISLTGQ